MKNSMNALLLTAALSGLVSGTSLAAQTTSNGASAAKVSTSSNSAVAGVRYVNMADKPAKHSCKGKNDCKGQGGCKAGDNGCKAKNICKGKGGCATDGSKPPKAI